MRRKLAGSIGLSTKLLLLGLLAFGFWFGGKQLARGSAVAREGLGRVEWVGDASYDASNPGVGMHAKLNRRIAQEGVRVLLDGSAEPLELTDRGSRLRGLSQGDRVRVAYREGGWLFWHELSLLRIEKVPNP